MTPAKPAKLNTVQFLATIRRHILQSTAWIEIGRLPSGQPVLVCRYCEAPYSEHHAGCLFVMCEGELA